MKKRWIIGIIAILVIVSVIFLSVEIEMGRSWTTAICEGNACRDYQVDCLGKEVINIRPVSGLVVFGDDWVDRRENKELC